MFQAAAVKTGFYALARKAGPALDMSGLRGTAMLVRHILPCSTAFKHLMLYACVVPIAAVGGLGRGRHGE